MTEGSSGLSLTWIMKLFGVIVLTILPAAVLIEILRYVSNLPGDWLSLCFLLSTGAIFMGWTLLFFFRRLKGWLYTMVIPVILVLGTYLVSFLLAISTLLGPVLGPASLLLLAGVAFYLLRDRSSSVKTPTPVMRPAIATPDIPLLQMRRSQELLVAGIEVTNVPRDYIDGTIDKRGSFQSMLRHLNHSGAPVGMRILSRSRSITVTFTTWASTRILLDQQLQILFDTIRTNLPEFGTRPIHQLPSQQLSDLTGGSISGIPLAFNDAQQHQEGIGATATLLEEVEEGLIQVTIEPHHISQRDIGRLEDAYKRAAESSEITISKDRKGLFTEEAKESRTEVNVKTKREAEKLRRRIDRLTNKHLCRVRVNVLSWGGGPETSRQRVARLASSLMGTLRPDDQDLDFELLPLKRAEDLQRSLQGRPVGKESVLTLDEAVNYLLLPKCDLGIEVTTRSSFTTSTKALPVDAPASRTLPRQGKVEWVIKSKIAVLGNLLTQNGMRIGRKFSWLRPDDLESHMGIYGDTRSGKTRTSLMLAAQLERDDVFPLITVPYKPHDWRVLADISNRWRFFSIGNPAVAPLAYNGFGKPKNVVVSRWIHRVIHGINASLPNDSIIRLHVRDVVKTAYRNCGWSEGENIEGRPVLLTDMWEAMNMVLEKLHYGNEVHANLIGALESRFRSLLENPVMVSLFNTTEGITIEELLAHPTVLEIDRLNDEDKRMFMALLTSAVSEYYLANPQKRVKNVLILEEAHILLKRGKNAAGEETTQDVVIDSINEMLRTVGGTGLGIITMDQLPSTMDTESVRLPVNCVIHSISSDQERKLVGGLARCTEAQVEHIGGMKKGEAIVYLARDREPKNIQVLQLGELFEEPPIEHDWTDEMMRAHMAPVYEQAPHLKVYTKIPPDYLERHPPFAKRSQPRRPDVVAAVTSNPKYLSTLTRSLETSLEQAERFLRKIASRFADEGTEDVILKQLLRHARGVLGKETLLTRIDELDERLAEGVSA